MSVEISPANTLGFPRPLTQLVKRSLLIHNPNSSPIAFKVKTTAPKQYCVRPNSGRVEAGESIEVQVLLQPLPQDPPPHAKCKDKFLVQSAFISPDEEMRTLAEMWSQTEKTNKGAIQEQKVKCAYLPAEDGTTNANGIPEEPEDQTFNGDQSRLDESHLTSYGFPRDGLSHWTTSPEKEIDPTLFRNGGKTYWEVEQPKQREFSAQSGQIFSAAESSPVNTTKDRTPPVSAIPAPVISRVNAAVQPPLPPLTATSIADTKGPSFTDAALEKSVSATTSTEDKLKAALAEIEHLQSQLADAQGPQVTGLRKRGGGQGGIETAVEKAKEVVNTSGAGVPVEVVGAIVLAVFVMTYLFF